MGKTTAAAAGAIGGIITGNAFTRAAKNDGIFRPDEASPGVEKKSLDGDNSLRYSQEYQEPVIVQTFPSVLPFPGATPGDDPDHRDIILEIEYSKPLDPSYFVSRTAGGFAGG